MNLYKRDEVAKKLEPSADRKKIEVYLVRVGYSIVKGSNHKK